MRHTGTPGRLYEVGEDCICVSDDISAVDPICIDHSRDESVNGVKIVGGYWKQYYSVTLASPHSFSQVTL